MAARYSAATRPFENRRAYGGDGGNPVAAWRLPGSDRLSPMTMSCVNGAARTDDAASNNPSRNTGTSRRLTVFTMAPSRGRMYRKVSQTASDRATIDPNCFRVQRNRFERAHADAPGAPRGRQK